MMSLRDQMTLPMPRAHPVEAQWPTYGLAVLNKMPTEFHARRCWGFHLSPPGNAGIAAPSDNALLREMPAVLHRVIATVSKLHRELDQTQQSITWNWDKCAHIWFRTKYANVPGVLMPPVHTYRPPRGCLCCLSNADRADAIAEAEGRRAQT